MSEVPATPHLLVLSGPEQGSLLPLDQNELVLGRLGHYYLVPAERLSLSREHARLRRQLNLYWLEDLDSANGTFITPPGAYEIRLEPNQPSLLLEGSQVRLGPFVLLQVRNIITPGSDELDLLQRDLHNVLAELYTNLPKLNDYERKRHLEALRLFEKSLLGEYKPEELAQLIDIGIQSLVNDLFNTIDPEVKVQPVSDPNLPDMPSDLPRPEPVRLRTIMNTFVTNIRVWFPQEDQDRNDG